MADMKIRFAEDEAKDKKEKKAKKKWPFIVGGIVGAIAVIIGGWYALYAIDLVDYTPVQMVTGKHGTYATVKEYKGLEYTEMTLDITDEDVEAYYNSMLDKAPNYVKDDSRKGTIVKKGDILNIDFDGKVDGKSFTGGAAKDNFIEIGAGKYIPGFEEAIIGHEVGTTFDIDVTFPEGYSESLSGKDAVFTIVVNYAANKLDNITDDYIAKNTDYKTKAEFEEQYLLEALKAARAKFVHNVQGNEVAEKLIANSEYHEIDADVSNYYNNTLSLYTSAAESYGITLAEYIEATEEMGEIEFKEKLRAQANAAVKRRMALQVVAKKEKLKVTDEIYEKYIEDVAADNNSTRKDLEAYYGKDTIKDMILDMYALDYVLEQGKAVPASK